MNPSPNAIAWIKAFAAALDGGWAGNSDAVILAAANLPSGANPVPQGQVPTPYHFADLLAGLSASSIANLKNFPTLGLVIEQVNSGDLAASAAWITFFVVAALITTAEAAAISATVTATIPDPAWPAEIGAAAAALGRDLDLHDVLTARGAL